MKTAPIWEIPANLDTLLDADKGGMWEDDRWAPITLTVMKGTSYARRDIPLAWQIEFEPFSPTFEVGNKKITALGLDADGYGWASLINSVIKKYHPEIADELQFGDTDESACVVWVESEASCIQLMQVAWTIIHA